MHCLFVKYIQFCKKMSSGPPPKRLRQIFLNFKRTSLTASMLIICAVDIQVNWNFDSQKALWLTPVWTAECDKFCSSAWDSTVKTFTASGGGALPPTPWPDRRYRLALPRSPCPRLKPPPQTRYPSLAPGHAKKWNFGFGFYGHTVYWKMNEENNVKTSFKMTYGLNDLK